MEKRCCVCIPNLGIMCSKNCTCAERSQRCSSCPESKCTNTNDQSLSQSIVTNADNDSNNNFSLSSETQVLPALEDNKTFMCAVNLEQHHRPVSVNQASRVDTFVPIRECLPTETLNKRKQRCCRCRPTNDTRCHTSSCLCRANKPPCTDCLNGMGWNEFNERKMQPVEPVMVEDVSLKHERKRL